MIDSLYSLWTNSSGNCKLKPLLFYHIINPNEPDGFVKGTPSVIWTFRTKFWMAATVLWDWSFDYFIPEVKKYSADNNIPFTAVLNLDNTLDHFPNFQLYHSTMKIIFLPHRRMNCFTQCTGMSLRPSSFVILDKQLQGWLKHSTRKVDQKSKKSKIILIF
jgi:hypothetical protein